MIVFSDPRVTQYDTPGHPEGAWRVATSAGYLSTRGFTIQTPTVDVGDADILRVHTRDHLKSLQVGTYLDPDTPAYDNIDEIARISLAGCLSAMDAALKGETAFSLMRPPGHHAGKNRVSGFCYLNHIAIASARALAAGLKVATLDIDVHHGDGTEEIAMGKKNWLYVSLHQSPLYPGTGNASIDNCRNYPLPPHTKPDAYLTEFDKALKEVTDFNPDLLGVSAGFDTYKECPIAQMKLEKETYGEIGKRIAATGLKRFAILEGGYAKDLPVLIENYLKGFK